jgi:general secretion pathway protein D
MTDVSSYRRARATTRLLIAWVVLMSAALPVIAAEPEQTNPQPGFDPVHLDLPRVPTRELLDRLVGSPRKSVLMERDGFTFLVTGTLDRGPISYSTFLTILRLNGLTAVVTESAVVIVPDVSIRQQAIPTITTLNEKLPDDQWVSFLMRVQHVSAAQLVPILRPMMPQSGHMAAFPEQNTLLFVDRFSNVRRLAGLVKSLDSPVQKAN